MQIGVCIVPVLADDDAIRPLRLDGGAQPPPERVRDLIRDIQPPAVDRVLLHIIQRHADEIVLHLRIGRVPLGHIVAGGKARIVDLVCIDLIPFDEEPVEVLRPPPLLQDILKLDAFFADVIENCVQHDADSRRVRTGNKIGKVLFPAEHFIDLIIVRRVILVVADRAEHGREIEGVHAQLFEIGQLLRNPLEVAARKALGRRTLPPREVDIAIVLLKIAARKAVDKDLIEARVLHPTDGDVNVRLVEIGELKGVIIAQREVERLRQPVLRIVVRLSALRQRKDVDEAHVVELQFRRIIVEEAVGIGKAHGRGEADFGEVILPAVNNLHGGRILLCRAQAQRHAVLGKRVGILRLRFMVNCLFSHRISP